MGWKVELHQGRPEGTPTTKRATYIGQYLNDMLDATKTAVVEHDKYGDGEFHLVITKEKE
tara:strand:+ start:290 stop:469 length:180 start_codon:yes stop_codon:yes gene_type:complete